MKLFVAAVSLFVVVTTATAQPSPLVATDAPIGPRDVLDLKVLEDPTMNERLVVGDDGQILVKWVGEIPVAGLTVPQIETRLKTLLEAGFLNRATVSIQILEYASQPISVVGAVIKPGQIRSRGTPTLIQAITEAGGLAENHSNRVFVIRTGRSGITEQLEIDIQDLMQNGNPALNIPLAPSDLINVPVEMPITVYVLGEVAKPGVAQFRRSQTPTLLQAIAATGGQTDRASSIAVIKRLSSGQEQHIKVNYRDILNGDRKDEILQDNDTIYIRTSFL